MAQPRNPKVELRNKPKASISPSKKAEFRQSGSGDSPIPKRAKFIKKFSVPKMASKDKKKLIKTSSTKLTAEGGKMKKSEIKPKKSESSAPGSAEHKMPPAKLRKESATKETSGKKRKVSKTNAKQVPEPMSKKKADDDLEPQKLQEPAASSGPRTSGSPQAPPTSCEMVAGTLAEKLVKETISTQSKYIILICHCH